MGHKTKTKAQLENELIEARQLIAELRTLDTERKKVEEALKEEHNFVSAVLDTISALVLVLDKEGRIVRFNRASEELTGYSFDEVKNKYYWREFLIPEEIEFVESMAKRMLRGEIPLKGENYWKTRSGDKRLISWSATGLFDNTGKIEYIIATGIDITARKIAEEKVRKSEKRFRRLVESSLIGILIIQNDQIVYKNPELKRIFGYSPKSFKFSNFKNIHPDDVDKVNRFHKKVISGKAKNITIDFRFYPVGKSNDGVNMRWVICRANLIEYSGKESILINIMDITREMEMEYLLRIKDKMSSLGHLAAGIAHEIRNPLSGINIFLDTAGENLEEIENNKDAKELFNQAKTAAYKIESVVKRILDFSRSSPPKLILTDINILIKEAINLSHVTLRKFDVKLESCLDENLPLITIDSQMIEEVMLNLITNAIEAMKNIKVQKNILITSFKQNNHIIVKVDDSGSGIAPATKDKIFDPFYTTKDYGTGIGLSFCQRIVVNHGGALEVSTSKLGGAEFTIRIPIKRRKKIR